MEGMGREQMRAADEDRHKVAEQLRLALEEGRLDLTEYDERVQGAYAAKTYADLDRLLTDLPNAAPVVPATHPGELLVGDKRAEKVTGAWLSHVWTPWAKALVFFTLIWGVATLASDELLFYWPAWIVGPWGLVLVLRTVAGLTQGEPRRHAAESVHRQRLRDHKRLRKSLYRRAIAAGELPGKATKEQRKAFIAEAIARGELPPKPRRPGPGE